jgi:hypothetical protein
VRRTLLWQNSQENKKIQTLSSGRTRKTTIKNMSFGNRSIKNLSFEFCNQNILDSIKIVKDTLMKFWLKWIPILGFQVNQVVKNWIIVLDWRGLLQRQNFKSIELKTLRRLVLKDSSFVFTNLLRKAFNNNLLYKYCKDGAYIVTHFRALHI